MTANVTVRKFESSDTDCVIALWNRALPSSTVAGGSCGPVDSSRCWSDRSWSITHVIENRTAPLLLRAERHKWRVICVLNSLLNVPRCLRFVSDVEPTKQVHSIIKVEHNDQYIYVSGMKSSTRSKSRHSPTKMSRHFLSMKRW